jgi:hypothetical protein
MKSSSSLTAFFAKSKKKPVVGGAAGAAPVAAPSALAPEASREFAELRDPLFSEGSLSGWDDKAPGGDDLDGELGYGGGVGGGMEEAVRAQLRVKVAELADGEGEDDGEALRRRVDKEDWEKGRRAAAKLQAKKVAAAAEAEGAPDEAAAEAEAEAAAAAASATAASATAAASIPQWKKRLNERKQREVGTPDAEGWQAVGTAPPKISDAVAYPSLPCVFVGRGLLLCRCCCCEVDAAVNETHC